MTEKVSLTDQIAAIQTAAHMFATEGQQNEFFRMYPEASAGKVEALEAASRTLTWLQAHEQTIRDAISSARALDAAQDRP